MYDFIPGRKRFRRFSYFKFREPLFEIIGLITKLEARGDRPLQMTFEEQLDALIYFHLEEHTSGRHLIQNLNEETFAKENIAPAEGISKSSFFEAINSRGLEQMLEVLTLLQAKAGKLLPKEFQNLGELVLIDGTLIDATLSMKWADYRSGVKKAKVHFGFNLNQSIPGKIFLTNGKADERPYVAKILEKGQTGVMDRYYQRHKNFDEWQEAEKHFVCRIKDRTWKKVVKINDVKQDSIVFYDAVVILGALKKNRTEKEVRVVGYRVCGKRYWIATDRHDLSAEDVANAYKLRWNIEVFFGWWKRHLKVYHLIARSRYGLTMQILAGLITYILLAIYCHEEYGEKVSIVRVRELRNKIRNEAMLPEDEQPGPVSDNFVSTEKVYAKT
jgi:Transposase DDE domain.